MRNTLLTALGLLVLAAITLAAGQDAGQAADPFYEPVEIRSFPDVGPGGKWIASSGEPAALTLVAVSQRAGETREPADGAQSVCGTGAVAAAQTSGDPCVDCQIDCFDEFRACRQACGPIWDIWEYLGCFDNCVTEMIACEDSCPCP
jgi:hypothetical protein